MFKAHDSNITAYAILKTAHSLQHQLIIHYDFGKNNGDPIKTIALTEVPRSLDLSPDNKTVVIGFESGKTIVADSEKIKENEAFTSTPSVLKVIFHPVEPLVVSLYSNNMVRSWKLK
ncbi:MAG: hypothetical protein HC817_00290 [Saprospiraceae bacterium]|nr:hypothetical protein [Saprospiraceae bacterium]